MPTYSTGARSVVQQTAEATSFSTLGTAQVGSRGNAYAAEGFAARDPLDQIDGAGNALTQHASPDITSGFDRPMAAAAGTGAREGRVRLLRTEAAPLPSNAAPRDEELVEWVAPDTVAGDTFAVTHQYGTAAAPGEMSQLVPDPLFIGGRPAAQDVAQGGFGSCYLLADLIGVVCQDPAQIGRMLSVQGGVAVCTFHHFDPNAGAWLPVPIVVDTTLAQDVESGLGVVGAGFRVSPEPAWSEWFADVTADELQIWRKGFHEAAMWPALIEKAYARFCELFGQYGGHPDHERDEKIGGSGYDAMEGGFAAPVMRVIYGEGVTDFTTRVADDPTGMSAHKATIRQLVGLATPSEKRRTISASGSASGLATRLAARLTDALAEPNLAPGVLRACQAAREAALDFASDPGGGTESLAQAAADLHRAMPSVPSASLQSTDGICTVLSNLGVTDQEGPRSIYAGHSYAVLGAGFRAKDGAALDLSFSDIPGRLEEIDPERSEVRLQNPHHTNEPDRQGDGPDDGVDDGQFTLTLRRFLDLYTQLDTGVLD